MMMEIISNKSSKFKNTGQNGMSLIAVMAVMTLFAIALLAVAPTVQQGIQREKELEQIRRGEEVAEAIKQYVIFYQGAKLPKSMDDLLEGLPQGTKKRQILRTSAAVDPLSADGKWRLISPTSKAFLNFGKRVQLYNNGVLPGSPGRIFDNYALPLVNLINSQSEDDLKDADDDEFEVSTEDNNFIGVASQSRSSSVISYYGIENHSKWVYTPLFRSTGATAIQGSNNGGSNIRPNSNIVTSIP